METVDFRKNYKHLYSPTARTPELVTMPPMTFLAIDGRGAPDGEAFELSIQAVYSMAFTIKFGRKKARMEPDFKMGPLEGLWSVGDENRRFDFAVDGLGRDRWQWTLLFWMPDFITKDDLRAARVAVADRKPNPMLDCLHLWMWEEGLCVQMLHVGPYSEEEATIAAMDAYMAEHGYAARGRHHEIYLGDPRRADPSKLKTILRHPVEKLGEG